MFEGEIARPVQISIWYPTEKMDNADHMLYEEYIKVIAEETNFGEISERDLERAKTAVFQQARNQGVSDEELEDLMKISILISNV